MLGTLWPVQTARLQGPQQCRLQRPACAPCSQACRLQGQTCSTCCKCTARAGTSLACGDGHPTAARCGEAQPAGVYAELPAEFWDERRLLYNRMRHERDRANRRQRVQQLREAEQARLAALTPEQRQAYESQAAELRRKASQEQKAALAAALAGQGLRVVIDCSFAAREECSAQEIRSLAKQIEIAMAMNRRSSKPVCLGATSFSGALATFADHLGAKAWPMRRTESTTASLYEGAQVVVLSPDADDPLLELEDGCVYVIGGIVDRSVRKSLTSSYAERRQWRAVRLPVAEYAEQLGLLAGQASKRPILNVSDAVVALIEYNRTGDWVHALRCAIPARKLR